MTTATVEAPEGKSLSLELEELVERPQLRVIVSDDQLRKEQLRKLLPDYLRYQPAKPLEARDPRIAYLW